MWTLKGPQKVINKFVNAKALTADIQKYVIFGKTGTGTPYLYYRYFALNIIGFGSLSYMRKEHKLWLIIEDQIGHSQSSLVCMSSI